MLGRIMICRLAAGPSIKSEFLDISPGKVKREIIEIRQFICLWSPIVIHYSH